MSIANTDSFPAGVKKLLAESRQRHDAWFATLPQSDPQTYMAIEQLRHQRRIETETRRQTTAAEAAAASAAQTAANTAAIANNTASIANSTQATANELEWRRRNNR